MSTVTLTLDGFAFKDFEIPESLPFGGEQSLSIKRLIGGERVIDALGSDDEPIEWSGRFRGSDAISRALQLDAKRRAGRAVALTCGPLSFQVIIRRFRPDFQQSGYEVPYSISCEIVPAQLASSVNADVGVDQMVKGDLSTIQALEARITATALDVRTALITVNNLITAPGRALGDLIGALGDAMGVIPNFAAATRASLVPVFQVLSAARQGVDELLGAADETLAATAILGGVDPAVAAPFTAEALLDQGAAMQQASDLQDLASYLGRIDTNLQAIGASGALVLMAGGDLFRLAAETYGDATEWSTIARVNGITDPVIEGVQTILVPPTPSNNDGVLNDLIGTGGVQVDLSTPLAGPGGGGGMLDFSDPDDSGLLPGI